MPEGEEVDLAPMTRALVVIAELMGLVTEALLGYRRALETAGFTSEASELMCVDYHRKLLDRIFQNLT